MSDNRISKRPQRVPVAQPVVPSIRLRPSRRSFWQPWMIVSIVSAWFVMFVCIVLCVGIATPFVMIGGLGRLGFFQPPQNILRDLQKDQP